MKMFKLKADSLDIVEEDSGLICLLGKKVLFHSMNYNYFGKLVGVNATCVELEEAKGSI